MKISVVIPAYNAEKTVGGAIESALAQTHRADEIIVIDDGSTDGTADVVGSFGDKVIFVQQENAGVSVARNAGVNAATGDWIAFLDSDDQWLVDKLQLQIDHLGRHPDLKWTYGNYFCRTEDGQQSLGHRSPALDELLDGREYFDDYLVSYVKGGHAWTCTLMIHRSVFEAVGLFEVGMKRAQDNDLWYRIAYQYPKVGYLATPLSIYHLDTPQSSTKINDQVDFMIELIKRHRGLSQTYQRQDAFAQCITHMLQVWMGQLVQQKRNADAKILLNRFRDDLRPRFRREMKFRLLCPPMTHAIADFVHCLKKRRSRA